MNKHYSFYFRMSSAGTYAFTSLNGTFPDVMGITSFSYNVIANAPSSATLYATTSESADQFVEDNIIGTVVFNSSGTVTIINDGKALSGKSYLGIVMNTAKRLVAEFSFDCDLASTVKVFNGSSWDECPVRAYNGAEFVPCLIERYDGTAFEECTHIVYEDN